MRLFWLKGLYGLVAALLVVSSMLTACGKAGDLYLPDDSKKTQPAK